jgi:hypothetical protein
MKFDFTYFLLRVLRYYYYISWVFSYTTKKLKYVVDRGIVGKLEVSQRSAQAWPTVCKIRDLSKIFRFY